MPGTWQANSTSASYPQWLRTTMTSACGRKRGRRSRHIGTQDRCLETLRLCAQSGDTVIEVMVAQGHGVEPEGVHDAHRGLCRARAQGHVACMQEYVAAPRVPRRAPGC